MINEKLMNNHLNKNFFGYVMLIILLIIIMLFTDNSAYAATHYCTYCEKTTEIIYLPSGSLHYQACAECHMTWLNSSAEYSPHTYGAWQSTGPGTNNYHYKVCTLCGYYISGNHSYGPWYEVASTFHRRDCTTDGCPSYMTEDHYDDNSDGVCDAYDCRHVMPTPTPTATPKPTATPTPRPTATPTPKPTATPTPRPTATPTPKPTATPTPQPTATATPQPTPTEPTHVHDWQIEYSTTGSSNWCWDYYCYGCSTWQNYDAPHDWDDGVITQQPTYTTEGIITYTCRNKSTHTKTETIPKLTPTPTATATPQPTATATPQPTPTEPTHVHDWQIEYSTTGSSNWCWDYYCYGCSTWQNYDAPHDWDDGIITQLPTYTTEGTITYTCRNYSSHIKIVSIPKLAEPPTIDVEISVYGEENSYQATATATVQNDVTIIKYDFYVNNVLKATKTTSATTATADIDGILFDTDNVVKVTVYTSDGNQDAITIVNKPYIYTKADMESFRDKVNGGKTYSGITVEVKADIDLEGSSSNSWTPIGGETYQFAGTFEGNAHTISGLYISDISSDYQGLFGETNNTAIIKDITVDGSINGGSYCGGIVGENKGQVENSTFRGSSNSGGGIVGLNRYTGSISNCDNYAGGSHAGIVGWNQSGSVEECNNYASLSGAGICTRNGGSISHCVNYGDITGIAGLVSHNQGDLLYSYNYGNVTWDGVHASDETGGCIGTYQSGKVMYCCNTGNVTGRRSVGGIIGVTTTGGSMQNDGNNLIYCCYNSGNITGTLDVGGILATMNSIAVDINNVYNVGTIKYEGGNDPIYYSTGGLIGVINSNHHELHITNGYNAGIVTNVQDDTMKGGVIGNWYHYASSRIWHRMSKYTLPRKRCIKWNL